MNLKAYGPSDLARATERADEFAGFEADEDVTERPSQLGQAFIRFDPIFCHPLNRSSLDFHAARKLDVFVNRMNKASTFYARASTRNTIHFGAYSMPDPGNECKVLSI
jgi:hypothetical protein